VLNRQKRRATASFFMAGERVSAHRHHSLSDFQNGTVFFLHRLTFWLAEPQIDFLEWVISDQ